MRGNFFPLTTGSCGPGPDPACLEDPRSPHVSVFQPETSSNPRMMTGEFAGFAVVFGGLLGLYDPASAGGSSGGPLPGHGQKPPFFPCRQAAGRSGNYRPPKLCQMLLFPGTERCQGANPGVNKPFRKRKGPVSGEKVPVHPREWQSEPDSGVFSLISDRPSSSPLYRRWMSPCIR
jgi:hypothetical protein